MDDVERLYREYGDMVLRRAQRILGSESDAQEVLQELFMSFLRDPSQLKEKTSLTGWLYGATTHLCLNTIRNKKNRLRLLSREAPAAAAPPRAEERVTARELLAQLPDELARVAIYYYLDEMTHEEIAGLIGCSRRHVGDLLEQAQARWQVRA
jgi:RNA polymerase sigma-70 factor (ECF subfamily)